jgi:hypothetical protein
MCAPSSVIPHGIVRCGVAGDGGHSLATSAQRLRVDELPVPYRAVALFTGCALKHLNL